MSMSMSISVYIHTCYSVQVAHLGRSGSLLHHLLQRGVVASCNQVIAHRKMVLLLATAASVALCVSASLLGDPDSTAANPYW